MTEVRIVDYAHSHAELHEVRMAVFVEEQGVPAELEIDALDPTCVHVAAYQQDHCIGTGRMTLDGRIGRMAVLSAWRGQGIGASLLAALIQQARGMPLNRLVLSSQVHACAFYRRFGFEETGPVFSEAGIPHQKMVLNL